MRLFSHLLLVIVLCSCGGAPKPGISTPTERTSEVHKVTDPAAPKVLRDALSAFKAGKKKKAKRDFEAVRKLHPNTRWSRYADVYIGLLTSSSDPGKGASQLEAAAAALKGDPFESVAALHAGEG